MGEAVGGLRSGSMGAGTRRFWYRVYQQPASGSQALVRLVVVRGQEASPPDSSINAIVATYAPVQVGLATISLRIYLV